MPRGKPKYSSRQLTNHLRELAAVAHDWSEEEGVLTKGEALARLLWERALGFEERTVDEEGKETIVKHPPQQWAVQLVYDRIEGKTPQAVEEDETKIKALDKVRELAADRVSAMAREAAEETEPPTPDEE